MKKRLMIITLALALLLASCSSANDTPAGSSDSATEATTATGTTEATTPPAALAGPHRTAPTDDVVISMGDYSVTMADYTYYFSVIREGMTGEALQMGYTDETMGELWDMDQGGQTVREMLKSNALGACKEQAILYDMAVKAGTAPDEEMNQSGNDMADQFLAEVGGDEQAFVDRYLITPAQMKDIGSKINLVDIYYNGVADSAVITDEELQAEYEANQALYEQVTVRHVLILTENMTDEQKADAKKRADDVFARLQAGEDIGALATELSEDPGSKDTNGEYTFPRGQMVAPFEDWAFAAKVGDQGIVETDYGYHVMELMAEANFEAAKPLVEESLRQQKTQTAFAELPELVESPDWVVDTAKLDALEP